MTYKTLDEVPVAHVYDAFRQYVIADKNTSAKQHLADLHKFAAIYKSFSSFPQSSRAGLFFYRLDILGVTTAYPFLLGLFSRLGAENPDTLTVLKDIESYLVRRMVCQLTTRGYNTTFIDLLSVFNDADHLIAENVHKKLESYDAESNRWPDNIEFRESWLSRPVYNLLQKQRTRMLLEALERQLFTEFTENLEIKTNLTIEHIMPQGWGANWPLPEGSPPEVELNRNRIIHTFGNLTLLTKKLNPSISNGDWTLKQDAVLHHSALALNRQLADFPSWGEETIETRGQKLFEKATQIWPVPKS